MKGLCRSVEDALIISNNISLYHSGEIPSKSKSSFAKHEQKTSDFQVKFAKGYNKHLSSMFYSDDLSGFVWELKICSKNLTFSFTPLPLQKFSTQFNSTQFNLLVEVKLVSAKITLRRVKSIQ